MALSVEVVTEVVYPLDFGVSLHSWMSRAQRIDIKPGFILSDHDVLSS